MYLYVSLLGRSQPEFLAKPICLLLRPLQCQPITYFVSYYDRFKRLILTYLEKALSKIFKINNLERKLCHQVLKRKRSSWKRKRFKNCRFHIPDLSFGSLIFGFGVSLICSLCICIDACLF